MTFVLAIDQGTSATKAVVVDAEGNIHGVAQVPVHVVVDTSGGVEVDSNELLQSVIAAGNQALATCGNPPLSAVGLANQGETIVAWSRRTGIAQHNAIVWQDRRAVDVCREIGDRATIEKRDGRHRYYDVIPPARIEMMEKLMAKLLNQPRPRCSSWAYPKP